MEQVFPSAVLRRLNDAGFAAWFVGGCVRDALLGRTPGDFDVATDALPEQVQAVFADRRVIPTGLRHGTVTVLLEQRAFEITTFRREAAYSDHRHPDSVSFTSSLEEDLARRDFTVNAMAWHPEHGLFDPFGGREDCEAGVIRCVGEPELRFREDALRILRALRFSSVLGFPIAPQTAAAAVLCRELLNFVSAERVAAELVKLLCGGDVLRVLLDFPEVLGVPVPELLPMLDFDQRNPHHCWDVYRHTALVTAAVPPEPALRLAALLHDAGKPACFRLDAQGVGHFYGHAEQSEILADRILRRLRLDRATAERVLRLVRLHDLPVLPPEEKTVKRLLNRLGEEDFFRLMALKRADNLAQHPDYRDRQQSYDRIEALARQILESRACFSLKDLAVSGRDLLALGMRLSLIHI